MAFSVDTGDSLLPGFPPAGFWVGLEELGGDGGKICTRQLRDHLLWSTNLPLKLSSTTFWIPGRYKVVKDRIFWCAHWKIWDLTIARGTISGSWSEIPGDRSWESSHHLRDWTWQFSESKNIQGTCRGSKTHPSAILYVSVHMHFFGVLFLHTAPRAQKKILQLWKWHTCAVRDLLTDFYSSLGFSFCQNRERSFRKKSWWKFMKIILPFPNIH